MDPIEKFNSKFKQTTPPPLSSLKELGSLIKPENKIKIQKEENKNPNAHAFRNLPETEGNEYGARHLYIEKKILHFLEEEKQEATSQDIEFILNLKCPGYSRSEFWSVLRKLQDNKSVSCEKYEKDGRIDRYYFLPINKPVIKEPEILSLKTQETEKEQTKEEPASDSVIKRKYSSISNQEILDIIRNKKPTSSELAVLLNTSQVTNNLRLKKLKKLGLIDRLTNRSPWYVKDKLPEDPISTSALKDKELEAAAAVKPIMIINDNVDIQVLGNHDVEVINRETGEKAILLPSFIIHLFKYLNTKPIDRITESTIPASVS